MASSLGRIKSLSRKIPVQGGAFRVNKEKILKNKLRKNGYLDIQLSHRGRTYQVHRLVAEAFIPNLENKPQVNHINGIPSDNRVENLEWVTRSENMKHAFRIGLQKPIYGRQEKHIKFLKKIYVLLNGKIIYKFDSLTDCGNELNLKPNSISRVLRGKRNHYHNYTFKYAE